MLGSLFLGILVAFLVAMAVLIPLAQPPEKDVQQLFLFMATTGGVTVFLSYLLYRSGVIQHFRSLRNLLLAIIVFTVALVFVNVWFVAQLMFISSHDLILTTALLVFAGIVSVLSVYLFASTLTDRINELGRAAKQLASGQLTIRLPIFGNDELARLTQAFNQMADSLQMIDEEKKRLDQTRRDLIAWVSHDLRTPLAAIRVMNEAIIDGVASDPQTIARYIQTSQREVENLSRLIDDLFELAQLDAGHLKLGYQATSLRDLISDTLGSMKAQAAAKQIAITGQVDDGVDMIAIAPDKIQRVLYNLLDNALRHTPPAGQITLLARQQQAEIWVKVHNTGSVIAARDVPHIFERFYQGEPSRTASGDNRRGAGLGLAIARGFVEAHQGRIWVENQEGDGTTFTFTLPLKPPLN